jgi:uncharacterized membrane protein
MTTTQPGAHATERSTHPLIRVALAIERAESLDALVDRIAPFAESLVRSPRRRNVLQGRWLTHSAHPFFVTVPLGMWTAVGMFDLVGTDGARAAARTLTGWSLVYVVPSALTGLAEWAGADRRDRRTATVHALSNVTGSTLYLASWTARRRDRHLFGAVLGGLGYAAVNVGGFLGGHLTEGRKVASRHRALEDS